MTATLKLPDGRPALELSFRLHLPSGAFYCGHIDKIANYGPNGIFIQERKHTAGSKGHKRGDCCGHWVCVMT